MGRQLIHEDHKGEFSRHVFAKTSDRTPALLDAVARNNPVEDCNDLQKKVSREKKIYLPPALRMWCTLCDLTKRRRVGSVAIFICVPVPIQHYLLIIHP